MANIKMNIKYIIKTSWYIFCLISTLITFFLSFISWEEMNIKNTNVKIIILIGIALFIFLLTSICVLFFIKSKLIWKKGKNEVNIIYSDLFKVAFQHSSSKRIVVIPVNDTFETIVQEPGEGVFNALVSPNTIHGRWILSYLKTTEISQEKLNMRIQNDLKRRNVACQISSKEILKGNKESYPIGSIAVIDGPENCVFYLIAISKFDENNNAQSTKIQIRNSIDNLMEFYDKNGLGYPIYIPLIGTGNSRAGLTHEESLNLIKTTILTNEKLINGKVNIVIYKKDKDKVSIFK